MLFWRVRPTPDNQGRRKSQRIVIALKNVLGEAGNVNWRTTVPEIPRWELVSCSWRLLRRTGRAAAAALAERSEAALGARIRAEDIATALWIAIGGWMSDGSMDWRWVLVWFGWW